MNYYNENDPKAAAWLRELIAQGHIPPGHVDERSITEIKLSAPALPVNTAFDLAEHGKLDKEPTPLPAKGNSSSCATDHYARIPVCEPHLALSLHHNFRRPLERQNYTCGIGSDLNPGAASLLCGVDKPILFQDYVCATRVRILRPSRDDTRRSMSISDSVAGLLGTFFRSCGNHAQSQGWADLPISKQLRISASRIYQIFESDELSRNGHMAFLS